ncbi:MAG: hypothetical protein KJO36_09475 [Acidimicrobiia bacterium]|nr:hypothetical protein [Acidimicrobiia bacterium]
MKRYRLYGYTVATDFPFANRLLPGVDEPDLYFGMAQGPLLPDPAFTLVFQTEPPLYDGKAELYVYEGPERSFIFEFTGATRFQLSPTEILFEVLDYEWAFLTEIYFLGIVMSSWLELAGTIALHASSVVIDGSAVAFIGLNQAGKSTLAASLMVRGHPLLTDDVLAIRDTAAGFVAFPGYPQMRMWPETAQVFGLDPDKLPQVHREFDKVRVPIGKGGIGVMREEPASLTSIFILDRRDDTTKVTFGPTASGEAMTHVLRTSFAGLVLGGLGVNQERLPKLAELVHRVSITNLLYPSRMDGLVPLLEAVESRVRGRI